MIRMLLLAIGIFILLALLVSPPRARAEATDSSRTHTTVIDGQWQRIQPTCNPYQAWQPRPQYYYGNHELAARQAARPRDPQSFAWSCRGRAAGSVRRLSSSRPASFGARGNP
jgi:hypothetical protein